MQCYHFQLNGNEHVLRNVTRDLKNSKFRTKEGQISLHHQGKQSPRTEDRERHGERVQSQINTFPRSEMKDNCLILGAATKIVYVLGVPTVAPTVAQQK